jgi:hypothetical protein
MPLIKLHFQPGINKETTALADKQTWFAGNNVRFRSGVAEKIGGWVLDTGSNASALQQSDGQFWGVARSLFNWVSIVGVKLLGMGTSFKYYIQGGNGGNFNDVTPLRLGYSAVACTFTATSGSNSIKVTTGSTSNLALPGAFVTFSGAVSLGGNITATVLNAEFQIQTVISNTQFTVTAGVNANSSDTGTGGSGATAAFQINPNGYVYQPPVGWSAGGWGGVNTTGSTSASFTGAISGTTLTASSVSGKLAVGQTVQGTGVAPGTTISAQLTGTAGGAGTYSLSVSQTVSSEAMTSTSSTTWGNSVASSVTTANIQLWSQSNYGENLVINQRGGPIYYWVLDDNNPATFYRAQQLSPTNTNTQIGNNGVSAEYWYTDTGTPACPTIANFLLVSDQSRFVIAYGTDNPAGGTSGVQDPMLISWSDQENITVWYPSATNQAGNYRLSTGSQIITAIQMTQQILVFTDTAIYSQQYLGPPYVWGFQIMGSNTSILSQNCVVVANNTAYWMGVDKFYAYNGAVQTLPSAMRKYVYENINLTQASQFFAGSNEGFSEIWWYYCSAASNTIDSYVIYNYVDQSWSYGNTNGTTTVGNTWAPGYVGARTAWAYSPLRNGPMSTGYSASGSNGVLIYQEQGVDDGTTTPATAIQSFIQSGDFDIGDGDRYGFAWRMVPDVSFDGSNVSNPSCYMTLLPRQNPGSAYTVNFAPPAITSTQAYSNATPFYGTQQFTQQLNIRVRGRQMAMMVGSNTLGTQWQVGIPRIDVRPDGRKA